MSQDIYLYKSGEGIYIFMKSYNGLTYFYRVILVNGHWDLDTISSPKTLTHYVFGVLSFMFFLVGSFVVNVRLTYTYISNTWIHSDIGYTIQVYSPYNIQYTPITRWMLRTNQETIQ